jgi:hypothetical protein
LYASYDITRLVSAIREVSTATEDEQNPFQLVNVRHPRFYAHVKRAIESLRGSRTVLTVDALHEAALVEAGASCPHAVSLKETESAVAFLACIGEVVWFRDRSLCPWEDGMSSDDEYDAWSHHDDEADEDGNVIIDGDGDGDGSDSRNSNDYDNGNSSQTWGDSLDIGNYVVLNPHWLLNAVKGVLTHELSGDVKTLRQHWGDDARIFGSSDDERNGIVRWPLIESLLARRSEIASEPKERANTLRVLRMLLEHFNIIVPIRVDLDSAGPAPAHAHPPAQTPPGVGGAAKSGIGSILTPQANANANASAWAVGGDVCKSLSASELRTPPRAASGPVSQTSSGGSSLRISASPAASSGEGESAGAGGRDTLSPLASAGSTNNLESLKGRGVSYSTDPGAGARAGAGAGGGSASKPPSDLPAVGLHKRNKSVGDQLSSKEAPPESAAHDDYFLVPGTLHTVYIVYIVYIYIQCEIRCEHMHTYSHIYSHIYKYIPYVALLNDINRLSVPRFARPGQVRLERRFRLQRFVPPGLISRIVACSYRYPY